MKVRAASCRIDSIMETLLLTPVPAPRQSQRDSFKPSPMVKRYRAFRDMIAYLKVSIPRNVTRLDLHFVLPMPPSWSKKKRESHLGELHRQTPDIDNLVKAFLDSACPKSDAFVPSVWAIKTWGDEGKIMYRVHTDPIT